MHHERIVLQYFHIVVLVVSQTQNAEQMQDFALPFHKCCRSSSSEPLAEIQYCKHRILKQYS